MTQFVEIKFMMNELRKCGVDDAGIQWYKALTEDMFLQIDDVTIKYDKGVPQGSILSPMMFDLVYDIVLREAVNAGWKVFAYADDLAIGITTQKDYDNVIRWLASWKSKVNLEINPDKTKEMRFGTMKHDCGKFETVLQFKYLGVYIYGSRRGQCAKSRLFKQAQDWQVIEEKIKHANPGIAKIAWVWWTVSKILYAAVSDVALKWLDPIDVELAAAKIAKDTYGVNRYINREFVLDFFDIHISDTLRVMAEKLRQKCGESLCVRSKTKETWRKDWIKLATRNDLRINQVFQWQLDVIWQRKGTLRCKQCGSITNMLHCLGHHDFDPLIDQFIAEYKASGIMFQWRKK